MLPPRGALDLTNQFITARIEPNIKNFNYGARRPPAPPERHNNILSYTTTTHHTPQDRQIAHAPADYVKYNTRGRRQRLHE